MNRVKTFILLCSLWLALCWPTNHLLAYRDLETGTFLTRDPAGFVDGPNLYAYVHQNPWTHFDPEGLWQDEDGPGGGMSSGGRIINGGRTYNPVETALINLENGVGNTADDAVMRKYAATGFGGLIQPGIDHPKEMSRHLLGVGLVAIAEAAGTGGSSPKIESPRISRGSGGLAEAELPVNKPASVSESPGGKSAQTTFVENQQAVQTYRGGPHSEMKKPVNDGLDSHHMPDRHADPTVSADDGPAIQMDPLDHVATSSNGRNGRAGAIYRSQTAAMISRGQYRDAMAREIKDVRRAAGTVSGDSTKYNGAMSEMLDYARSSGQLPVNPQTGR